MGGGPGAIPGSHDDGYLINSDWDPVAVVNTSDLAVTVGYRSIENAGFTWMAGVTHASVVQDLAVNFDFDPEISGSVQVSGTASNEMYGLTFGFEYQRSISNLWSFAVDANVSAFQNSYDYSYDYSNTEVDIIEQVSAAGESAVIRLDAAAKLAYALSETTLLTGSIGATNYSEIISGLDTLLNEENTISTVNPVTSSALLPYARIGVSVSF